MRCSSGPLRLAKRYPEPVAQGAASEHAPIALPKPRLSHGRTLASALRLRRTTRAIGDKALSSQTLSNLLWAAFGVNRKSGPFGLTGRTAASASNSQEIDVYVLMAGGTYLYEPYQEPGLHDPDVQRSYYYVDTGLIAANVYLFAASVGLAAWFHNCDRSALCERLGLRPDQHALFGQTVGYEMLQSIQCAELDTTG